MRSLFLLIALIATTNIWAQDLSYEYQYSINESEHYVINFPKDSSYLRWGIWLNAEHDEFGIHTMKMFMTESDALFLDEFIGLAQIEMENDESIPINVYVEEDTLNQFGEFDKILAFQFNDMEAQILMDYGIKKIVFFTTYGKFNARFANRKMMQSALETLTYNTEIFDRVQQRMFLTGKIY
jgi:hypothetical protein